MSERKFLVIFWIVFFSFILLFTHGAYADGIVGSINKDGSITISKAEQLKLSEFIIAQNKQLQNMVNEIQASNDRYEKAHACVMENALAGKPTTTCFIVCQRTQRFCGSETQEF